MIYENELLTKIINYQNSIQYSYSEFTYSDNKIIGRIQNGGSSNSYQYNSQNQLIVDKEFLNNILQVQETYEYSVQGNRIKETTFFSSSNTTSIKNFNYDSKKNPFVLCFPRPYIDKENFSGNNIISSENVTNNYVYNNNDFPMEIIKNTFGEFFSKSVYTYN